MDNDAKQLKVSEEIYSTFIGPKATKPLNLSMDWQEDLVPPPHHQQLQCQHQHQNKFLFMNG